MDDEIMKTLLEKATGFFRDEVQEEYAVTAEGETVLVKRKVIKKYYPPDGAALRTYLELSSGKGEEELSDEELIRERERLLAELGNVKIEAAREKARVKKSKGDRNDQDPTRDRDSGVGGLQKKTGSKASR